MRTWAPMATGISPPLSIMRPALISRSASLPIASISAGVGGPGGWDDVTIYMKRILGTPLEASRGHRAPSELSRYPGRRTCPGRIDMRLEKNCARLTDRQDRSEIECPERSEERRVGKEC